MSRGNLSALLPFLLLLFCGTVCASMVVPYMAYFLVEGLGQQPWVISVYSLLALCLTVTVNRQFARRIDGGARVHPLIGLAATGYLIANASIALHPSLWMVLTFGVVGFGLSSSSVSTMFSLGGHLAEGQGVDRARFNSYMRATTSTAWMIGPAVAFFIADAFGAIAVFYVCLAGATIWLILWWWALPKEVTAASSKSKNDYGTAAKATRDLWLATGFVFCLSSAHSLTFSSLPLFFVREVGLPGYAPGLAFSIKTFVEVFAIFSTPFLISRFGMNRSLLATTMLAVIAIQVLASVETFGHMLFGAALEGLYYGLYASLGISFIQSFAPDRPAMATALYWNALMISGILAGPAVGLIAQTYSFQAVVHVASGVALAAAFILLLGIWSAKTQTVRQD